MSKRLIQIYTDGACSPNPGFGGWAAVLIAPEHNNYRKEISGAEANTTNNRMELLATIEALAALKYSCNVELYTDSQYIQKAFNQGWLNKWQKNGWLGANRKPVANQDLWKRLLHLSKIHVVTWHWVKGHSNNVENNRCDEMAVQARQTLADQYN